MGGDLGSELESLQKGWSETSGEGGGVLIPNGTYVFKVEDTIVNKSASSGRLQMGMKLVVAAGEHSGKKVTNWQGLTDAVSLGWLRRNMAKLEVSLPDNIRDLPEWAKRTLVGITFQGQVKNADGFTNVYPQKRVTLDPTSGGALGAGRAPGLGMG